MSALAVVLGTLLVVFALADLVNTLVSTSTSYARFWPTRIVGFSTFRVVRAIARRLPEDGAGRQRLLGAFAPLLVIELLLMWVVMQITGFGLVWWGLDDVPTIEGFADAWYYSGVVFFTVGFGEIVPSGFSTRAGALVEAFTGVITVALVIGYLPSLYGAYSDRERQLETLDAGTNDRITPTALVKAWAPDADPAKLDAQFEKWEQWTAGILETQSTVPLLMLFRSHDRQQNWVTALGLLCDAALHAQIIVGSTDGHAYWFLRRAEALFREVTVGVDLSRSRDAEPTDGEASELFADLYRELEEHGFELLPFDDAAPYVREVRATFAPAMEYLIDELLCPRGFWSIESSVRSWSAAAPRPDAS